VHALVVLGLAVVMTNRPAGASVNTVFANFVSFPRKNTFLYHEFQAVYIFVSKLACRVAEFGEMAAGSVLQPVLEENVIALSGASGIASALGCAVHDHKTPEITSGGNANPQDLGQVK
jgi:hypothetical protein